MRSLLIASITFTSIYCNGQSFFIPQKYLDSVATIQRVVYVDEDSTGRQYGCGTRLESEFLFLKIKKIKIDSFPGNTFLLKISGYAFANITEKGDTLGVVPTEVFIANPTGYVLKNKRTIFFRGNQRYGAGFICDQKTGHFSLSLKFKPADFLFLDFGYFFCMEEIKLDRLLKWKTKLIR